MLRSRLLLKKLVPGSSLQYNLCAKQITSTKFYSTSIQNLDKKPTDQKGDADAHYEEAIKEEPLKENKTATQIDLRSQNTGMIEGSRINHYIKKKDIGMMDDESTIKGKVVAKTKDFTALIFAGGAAIALGYALYILAKEYFMKKPEDYAYENAMKCCLNHPVLENSLGVNYTVTMTDQSGRRSMGSKVQHEPAQKYTEMGDHVELMRVQFYAATKSRKCMLEAYMIKNEEDSASTYTPYLIYGITDYDKKNYARKVILIDYRKQMADGIDLIRQAHEGYLEGLGSASEIKFERKSEIAAVSNSRSGATVDSISLFGDIGGSKPAATNFASGASDDLNTSQGDSAGSGSGARIRPKF